MFTGFLAILFRLNCHKNAWANQPQTQAKQNTIEEI